MKKLFLIVPNVLIPMYVLKNALRSLYKTNSPTSYFHSYALKKVLEFVLSSETLQSD